MKINRGNFESNLLFLERTGLLKKTARILEIGAGRGALVKELRDGGYDITGTEVNPEYVAYAREAYDVELVTHQAKETKLPFPEQSFDVVLSFDVFEHIPDTDAHLQEVRRLLKKNGYYLFATPNKITNILFEVWKERSFTKYREYHCSLHTYRTLKKRLSQANFRHRFVEVPLVTPFFKEKVKQYLGLPGVWLVQLLRPDSWPMPLRTNFYVIAQKQSAENNER